MHGSGMKAGRPAVKEAPSAAEVAARLVKEFDAPVGLFDPKAGSWSARTAPPEAFPPSTGAFAEAAAACASGGEAGRVVVWKPGEGGAVWLLLALPAGPARGVAAVGFADPAGSTAPHPPGFGPPCPEPALRAWGLQVLGELSRGPAPRLADAEELLLVARLIRRVRISDPAERFQQLAANALRAAMKVQAVAWVPCHHAEPVVVIGDVGRMTPDDYRALIPCPAKESPKIDNDPTPPADPALARTIAVASDTNATAGWLIAVNPLDGRAFVAADSELMQPVASLVASQLSNSRVYADLKDLLFGVIRALTAAIDAKDPYTSGHSERVARIAVRLAAELGMPANQRGDLYLMSLLHDVGKIGVDDAVLKKTGPLTPEEYRQIQQHVEIGVHILNDLKKLNHLLPGVRYHHESFDGSGYPCGLAAEGIPLEARILAVADSFDAMSSTRPYRRRLTPTQIDEILRKGSGVQWDPKVIDALFGCRMDLEMIRQKGLGESLQLAVTETLGRG